MSAFKSEQSMAQSAVAVLMVDADHCVKQGGFLRSVEMDLVHHCEREGRALVVTVNKGDLLTPAQRTKTRVSISNQIAQQARALAGLEVR